MQFSKSKQRHYYYHKGTKATSWTVPLPVAATEEGAVGAPVPGDSLARIGETVTATGAAAAALLGPAGEGKGQAQLQRTLPDGWEMHTTPGEDDGTSGIPYYTNKDTGETSLTFPG